jgi:hypothetical protein
MNANRGFVAGNAGASDAKDASASLNDAMASGRCRYHGTAGMARWVGLGVIADNLINIAGFVNAKAAA